MFKIILGGGMGHSRTEIMRQFTGGQSHTGTRVIIGVDFAAHCVDLPENEGSALLQIWDFGEEKRFRTLIPSFCHGAAGAILYFDLQDSETLYQLEEWILLVREFTKSIPIIICGIYSNEISDNKATDDDLIQEFLNRHDLKGYYGIDLESGYNINESFDRLTTLMVELWPSMVLQNESQSSTLIQTQLN